MAKYVSISSELTVTVPAGMAAIDATDKKSHAPDRLNAKAAWVDTLVLIKAGTHWYPYEVTKYPGIQNFVNQRRMTIGMESDTTDDPAVEELRNKLLPALESYYGVEKKTNKIQSNTEGD